MKLLILADLHLDEISEDARHRLGRAIRHVGRDAELRSSPAIWRKPPLSDGRTRSAGSARSIPSRKP